jgi:hypothetical protein
VLGSTKIHNATWSVAKLAVSTLTNSDTARKVLLRKRSLSKLKIPLVFEDEDGRITPQEQKFYEERVKKMKQEDV